MYTVVFVDDEKSILEGLRRNLRRMRSEWEMHFFSEPREALEFIKCHSVSAVVSDMRMPGMSGAELLQAVQACSPSTVRLALSGYADSQLILESLHAIHRYISKPVELDVVRDAVVRSLALREQLDDPALHAYVGAIGAMPSLPEVYQRITQLVGSDEFSLADIAELIEQDVGLSTTVLKIVNSSFFGFFGNVDSIPQAVSMLGADTIKNIVLTESVVKQLSSADASELERLNCQAKIISSLAHRFAKLASFGKQAIDHSQLAGLMCTIGDMIVLDSGQHDTGAGCVSPPTLAGYMLSVWSLPDGIIEAVIGHREPLDLTTAPNDTLLAPQHCLQAAWIACEQYVECDPTQREASIEGLRAVFMHLTNDAALTRAWLGEVVECENSDASQVA